MEKWDAPSVRLDCTPCCSWQGPRLASMAGNARYGIMAVARSRGGTLFRKDAVRTRDKRLRLRKQTFGLGGLPTNQASSTFRSDMPCSMPLSRGLGQRKDQLNLRLGFASIRAPFRDLCPLSLTLQRLLDGPAVDDATTYANHSNLLTGGRSMADCMLQRCLNRIIHMRSS